MTVILEFWFAIVLTTSHGVIPGVYTDLDKCKADLSAASEHPAFVAASVCHKGSVDIPEEHPVPDPAPGNQGA